MCLDTEEDSGIGEDSGPVVMVNLGCQLDLRSTKTPLGESVREIPGEGLTEVGGTVWAEPFKGCSELKKYQGDAVLFCLPPVLLAGECIYPVAAAAAAFHHWHQNPVSLVSNMR